MGALKIALLSLGKNTIWGHGSLHVNTAKGAMPLRSNVTARSPA